MPAVWIIDDEKMTIAVELMLKLRSFLLAPKAVKLLFARDAPDIIVLDINMPEVSGKDFLEFVRMHMNFNPFPL